MVAGNGQSAAVTTGYASQLKASVQDAQGNGVPNVMVTFAAPASGASVSFSGPATVATDSTGVAAISVTANSQVGSVQVNATVASISTPAMFSLTNVAGTASQLKFAQQPTGAVAGAVIAPPITVQLTDSVGNSVATAGVAVTLSLNPVTGRLPVVSGITTIATDASGLATFTGLSIDAAGSYQFNAIAASLVSAQSNAFTITAGVPAKVQTVTGTPQSTTVLAPFAVPLQVLVTDSNNNPVNGVTVSFTAPASGASATLSAATATTDANGHASVTAVANATAGSYTVTASVSGASSDTFDLTNVGGSGASLVFTQQPADTPAGATIPPVTVKITDNGGNPVSGVTISLTAQGGAGVLSGATPTVTNSSGQATFSNLSINKAGTYALQATDGTRFATSNLFVIGPGTASSITPVSGSGQSAAVTTNYASQLKASVQDAQGNGVPNVIVTFSAPPSGASVTFSGPATVATDSTGVAAISVTANSQVGSFQVNAAAPGTPTPAAFTLTNVAGAASRLTFVQQPTTTMAGAIMTPAVTVQLTDSVGSPIAQAGVTVTVSEIPLGGRLRAISGTVANTDATGLATFSTLSISTAGNYQLTASGASLVSTQSNPFTITAGAASKIQEISGTPQSTTVLAPFAVPLQVLVTDSNNNPLSGIPVSFTVPTSGASATLSASTATTGAAGLASVTATANATAGGYSVTASVSGVTPSASFALTNLGGTGSNLVFTQQPVNTPAGATMPPVVVKVTDNGGNPVSGVTIALSAQGGPGTLSGTLPVATNASGLATFSNLSIDKTGTYALQATDGARFTTSASFVVSPGTSSNITIVAGDGQSAAVNTSYASQLKVSVQDAQGNGIPNVMVTFSPPATGPSVSFSGPVTVATDSTGVAAISVTANSQVGSVQVNAAASALSALFSLTNLAGTASQLKFGQQPTGAVAGAIITPPITVQLTDSVGNNVATAGVAVTLSLNPVTGRLPVVSGITTIATDASGLATFTGLSIDAAGSYQFTAIAPSLVSAQSNAFTITAGVPAGIQAVSGTPQSTAVLAPFAVPLQVLCDRLEWPTIRSAASRSRSRPPRRAHRRRSRLRQPLRTQTATPASLPLPMRTAGSYTVTASVSGASSDTFDLTNVSRQRL